MREREFSGQVAVVTGAAGDIGVAAARLFAERGAHVVAVDVREPSLEWRNASTPDRGEAITLAADICNDDDVTGMIAQIIDRFGRIDVLFNNAGIAGPVAQTEDYDLAAFEQVLRVNVTGVFLGMKHVLPIMYRQRTGSIINASSIVGLTGFPGMIGYTASKHAVIGLTRAAALEAAARNVRVNCINPGPIAGRMMNQIDAECGRGDTADRATFVPAKRYGTPDEVAALVAFLGSHAASFCNGGFYTVDGALSAA
jgi:3alpha(or 20beta)-hydroxysteroid dehydrogenase